MTQAPLLAIDALTVTYGRGSASVPAVRELDLQLRAGHTIGLVGESGSGKTSIGSVILGLVTPTSGKLSFDGEPLQRHSRSQRVQLARRIQAVFQDPFGSMNPTRKIGWTLAEPLLRNLGLAKAEANQRINNVLQEVGMSAACLDRYPQQFSGGQLQRIAIARALVMEPDLVICDEAVSSLDLSVQAQVINLFQSLAKARSLAYLFISHDLPVVSHLSDEIVVLFAGQVMEQGPADLISNSPMHPYTKNLVFSAPVPDPKIQAERRQLRRAAGSRASSQPSAVTDPRQLTGCGYALRCPLVVESCRSSRPPLEKRIDGRAVACHRYDALSKKVEDAHVR